MKGIFFFAFYIWTMPKEILLYGPIWDVPTIDFIKSLNEVTPEEGLVVRINSEGGDVTYGWGMVAKFNEYSGEKTVKVDGQASSMALNFLLYSSYNESTDVARFLLHRAAYGAWYEENYMTEGEKISLIEVNKSLEKAFRARVDVEKFESITDKKIKDIFSMDDRMDVEFSAATAKKIGLIDKIIKITPSKSAQINSDYKRIAAHYSGGDNLNTNTNQNQRKMTKDEFKKEHPEAYAAIVKEGTMTERDRVGAWSAFAEVDAKAVQDGIKSGEALSQTNIAEFTYKAISAAKDTAAVASDAPGAEVTATGETPTPTGAAEKIANALKLKVSEMSGNPKTV